MAPSNQEKGSWRAPEDVQHRTANPCISFFLCPNCKALESSSLKSFQDYDLDVKHICATCNKHQMVRNWKCRCNIEWHKCSEHPYSVKHETHHRASITANGHTPTAERNLSRKRKRQNHSESFEEIQQAAERKTDRDVIRRDMISKGETMVSLGNMVHTNINANFLSPELKRRFMGVGLGA